ncbi:MAG: exodeoxyribonuclease V subunit alpha [Colwellia polaris]|jgi:exodeoxyribonuclease V alpha subunit|uniref:exodeoxyribonuclease V subunit alpha n=1 Tax=Colwellia polaris TaxID=326537 RepID=UPI000A1760DF|nr:exodeoxyribonuclease V subunit alpha [Colwellia polaris]|tara:strand:+ start:43401 stop:45560 length:2160 start_codon:yes stop_codon:yes gene_type:complete
MSEAIISSEKQADRQVDNIYTSFQQAAKQLHGLVAVDYFFAKELIQCISFESSYAANDADITISQKQQQWFHLLIALSASLRDGHSCLPLNEVAGKRLFSDSNNSNDLTPQGFLFADLTIITELLAELPLANSHSKDDDQPQPIVLNHERLYLRRYYQFEEELKQVVRSRRSIAGPFLDSDVSHFEIADEGHNETGNKEQNDTGNIKNIIATLFPDLAAQSNLQANDIQTSEIDWQAVAVANAINKDFAIIAGGPGTGKTYTVTKLLAALLMLAKAKSGDSFIVPKISLVAPTGKAAQRLSESITKAVADFRGSIDDKILDLIPESAKTIHRLLGVIPEQVNFRHHQENKLDIDILLIDEVSMVDLPMMTRIFRALPTRTKVILLGDADQLPSVAVGSVLADFAPRPHIGFSALNHQYLSQVTGYQSLIKDDLANTNNTFNTSNSHYNQYSASDCVTFLLKSRRFDGEGGIGIIANLVINGQYQESWQLLKQNETLESSPQNEPLAKNKQLTLLSGNIETWLTPLVEQYYVPLSQCKKVEDAFALLAKFRILSSTRKGPQGVESLNALVIDILRNKGVIGFNRFESNNPLYAAQPIMINENDYRLGVYNGDIGVLWRNSEGHLMAVFEDATGGYTWILPSRLPKFETVYAMTIHKTQGSEFKHVAMVLPEQKDNRLLSRELLYTGITRAKQHLSIASSQSVWQSGVSQQVSRFSGLAID